MPGRTEHPGPIPKRGHYTEAARRQRLRWARDVTSAPLRSLERTTLDAASLAGNVENLVGSVEIPVGLAGPLLFSEHGWITGPLATTEGALVASVSRGARAASDCGGVGALVLKRRMTRAPLYELGDAAAADRFGRLAQARVDGLREQVRTVSQHAELVEVEPLQIGRAVHLRFVFETADAAGQNMTTACTWRAAQWLREAAEADGLEIDAFFLDGNSSGDKKLTHLNMLATRGARVTAECHVDGNTLRDVLKTSRDAMVQGHQRATIGGQLSGTVGYNINVTNVIAALFTATGQDIACVHESGAGVLAIQPDGDGIYASLLLPALVVGTVGGGTALPNQRDYLELLGCAGDGGSERLAEIVAGFALALELSTCAAMVGGQFADAHERLGRNRPVDWFTGDSLTPEWLTPMLAESLARPDLEVAGVARRRADAGMESGSVSALASAQATQKLVGVLPITATYGTDEGVDSLDLIVKSKPLDAEVMLVMNKVASLCGGRVAEAFGRWRERVGFKGSHTRELALYREAPQPLRSIMPRLYGIHENPEREAYILVLEDLDATGVVLKDSADDIRGWTRAHVDAAISGIARAHAVWLGREHELASQTWLGQPTTADTMAELAELWEAIAAHAAVAFPHWVNDGTLGELERTIADIPQWWPELEAMPRTLVHNDFSPRNIALRRDSLELVAYDWELATIHVPQRDLAELLAFVLTPDVEAATVEHHLRMHRRALEHASGMTLDPVLWRRGYRLALRDFLLSRLSLFLVAHTQRSYPFLHRVVPTVRRLVDIELAHERDELRV